MWLFYGQQVLMADSLKAMRVLQEQSRAQKLIATLLRGEGTVSKLSTRLFQIGVDDIREHSTINAFFLGRESQEKMRGPSSIQVSAYLPDRNSQKFCTAGNV